MSNEENTTAKGTLWEKIEEEYKNYYPGLLVQGFVLLDVADGNGRTLRFLASPDSTSWAVKGMLAEISSQLDAETVADIIMCGVDCDGDEEEDED